MTLRDKLTNLLILATIDGKRREILLRGILETIEESMPEADYDLNKRPFPADAKFHDGWKAYHDALTKEFDL